MGDSVLKMNVKQSKDETFLISSPVDSCDTISSLSEFHADSTFEASKHTVEKLIPENDNLKLIQIPARSGIFTLVTIDRNGTGITSKFVLIE